MGSGAFDVDKGKVFYGVGIASGIRNQALLRSTADNGARAEVAKILETYVAVLAKDYMASTTAGDMKASSEEQHVEMALKTFTKTTLHGAESSTTGGIRQMDHLSPSANWTSLPLRKDWMSTKNWMKR